MQLQSITSCTISLAIATLPDVIFALGFGDFCCDATSPFHGFPKTAACSDYE